jgi:hypothetical protein
VSQDLHEDDRDLAELLAEQGRDPAELEELMEDLERIRALPEGTMEDNAQS